jgi:hypothetical protein
MKKREEKKTMNLVATSFATQPVCNAIWVAHALRSDQFIVHFVCQAARLKCRTGNARTSLGPKTMNLVATKNVSAEKGWH